MNDQPPPSTFAHRFMLVNGLRTHFVIGGPDNAEVVVLLAGFPETWFAWRKVIPLLTEHYRVVALDLPGQGDTDKPLEGYDTQALAEHVGALLIRLGVTRYFLVGHDVGAWVAFTHALLFREELKRLVLLDAGIPGVTLPDMLPTAPDRAWRTWHFPFHAIPDLPEALIEGKERIYLDWFLRRKAADPNSFSEADIDEYLRAFRSPGGLRAGLAPYRVVSRSAEQNRALVAQERLTMPVLALSADQGSIADMASPLRPFASDVRGETIAACGHFLPEEQPDAVARVLMDFFGEGRVVP
ncbi:MAG TPA: alpha/beta hydrolase [Acetobacteraceae bacterium]|nr:alpha/beta hydrolase [Acetobacteraceae bacterium]